MLRSFHDTLGWIGGRGCFPRAVAPKVSPSKISMVIRSCTVLPTCMNCKTLSRGATPPPPLLFSRGLSPGVKQCYADIRWTGLFAPAAASSSSRGISLYRFVELVFEAIVSIDPRRAKSIHPLISYISYIDTRQAASIYVDRVDLDFLSLEFQPL